MVTSPFSSDVSKIFKCVICLPTLPTYDAGTGNESNLGHIGGRPVLLPTDHPCSLNNTVEPQVVNTFLNN